MTPPPATPEPVCLACGGARLESWARARDLEYFAVDDGFHYRRCTGCGSVSIDPVPDDRLEAIYPPSYYSFAADRSPLQRIKLWLDGRLFRRLFAGIETAELAALDVGGGTGWLLDHARALEPRLATTVVVDLDGGARAEAEAAGHTFVLGRIEDFDTNRKFDLILMLNLIEHVRDPSTVLAKMRALLAPGGQILIKTPNVDSLDARLFRGSYWGGCHCPRHFVLFTPESFQALVVRAGLAVDRLKFTQGAPFWCWSILAFLHRRGLIQAGRDRPLYRHPLTAPLTALFAAVDFLRLPFMRTSQMLLTLRHPG